MVKTSEEGNLPEQGHRNDTMKNGVLAAAIIAAVAGPMVGMVSNLAHRLDRMEARVVLRLDELDEKLQIEIAKEASAIVALDRSSADRHNTQQVEIMRLRDQFEEDGTKTWVEVLRAEIERLRENH